MRRESALCKSVNRLQIRGLMLDRAKSLHRIFNEAEEIQMERMISEIEQL